MSRPDRFCGRLPPQLEPNAISQAVARLRRGNAPFVDLTESNPTRVNLPYPSGILHALADPAGLTYEPDPLGLGEARTAVARDSLRRGVHVDPRDVVLTASTSESYSWLIKLLCRPGEAVAAPAPSYPLFEHLTRLEGIELHSYRLDHHGRWEIDLESIRRLPTAVRALILVSPNNPTGSYVTAREFEDVQEICRTRRWVLIIDEVFADYPLDAQHPLTDLAPRGDVLSFTLAGASKSLGLPQVKLSWMVAGGREEERREALGRLEYVADTFLSVSTPVQVAAPALLREGAAVRAAIHDRVRRNLARARALVRAHPACALLGVEGGWSATVRVPATQPEEMMVLTLLETERVLVHPGYFFDFPHEAFLVVSLLVEETAFTDALARALRVVN